MQPVNDRLSSGSLTDSVLAELNSHHKERDVLASVRLCTRHTDFGTSIDVYTTMRFPRNGGTDGVDDTDAERATLKTVPQREDCVGGLTRLRQEHADVVTEDGRLAVEEVGGKFD